MMKKLWAVAWIALLGCGPAINLSERPRFSNGVNTLTFLTYNALTGAPVEGAAISLTVGTYQFEATHNGENAYVVAQLPPGTHAARVEAPGFLAFLGQATADCSHALTGSSSQCFKTYQVALYPPDAVPNDIVVRAFESDTGAPVASGTVVATLISTGLVGASFPNRLPGSFVRPTTFVEALDATGTAVLAKEGLILGGRYEIDVLGARNLAGTYLSPAENRTVDAGENYEQVTVFMGPPSESPVALKVNNEVAGVRTALVVDFPYAVALCSDPTSHWATLSAYDGNWDSVYTTLDSATPVTAALAAGNTQLTLTPNYETAVGGLQADDGQASVSFSNFRVLVRGAASCVNLGSIRIRSSYNTVSTTIRVRDSL